MDNNDYIEKDKELKRERKFLRNVMATIPDSLLVLDGELRITNANHSFYKLFQMKPGGIIGRKIADILGDEDGKLSAKLAGLPRTKDALENFELHYQSEKLGERILNITARGIIVAEEEEEEEEELLVVIRDITERKEIEAIIHASLKEKETLLKEVHHRVKNNMQVISSLLNLQAGKVKDKDVGAMLKDSQNRIQSMALVYNKLYQSQNLARINMTDYIKELTGGLIKSYTTRPYRVTARIDPGNVFLSVDMAIPCGLVINELVTNSLKYAFPENRTGQIAISLKEGSNQELELVVSDNGVGIPEGLNPANTSTLGLKLVTNLIQDQLDGKIELDRSQGTTFKITFCQAKEEK